MGLLVMRMIAAGAAIWRGLIGLRTHSIALEVLGIAAGLLILAGLWTPIAGSLLAVVGLWNAISDSGDPWASILLATLGVGLAMVGPGAWSVDARLFGWKLIDIHDRKH